jgi:hypothetical protein
MAKATVSVWQHPLVFFQFYDVTWLAVKPINILALIGEKFVNKLSKLKKTGKTRPQIEKVCSQHVAKKI